MGSRGRPKRARRLRKEYPRWYCDKRRMVGLPFVWLQFVPDTPQCGVSVPGALVLVVTEMFEGRVLRVPIGNSCEQTEELFKEQRVRWWSYMPEMPLPNYEKSGPLSCDDFFHFGEWRLGGGHRRQTRHAGSPNWRWVPTSTGSVSNLWIL